MLRDGSLWSRHTCRPTTRFPRHPTRSRAFFLPQICSLFLLSYVYSIGFNVYNKQALLSVALPWTYAALNLSVGSAFALASWACNVAPWPSITRQVSTAEMLQCECQPGERVCQGWLSGRESRWSQSVKWMRFRFLLSSLCSDIALAHAENDQFDGSGHTSNEGPWAIFDGRRVSRGRRLSLFRMPLRVV